MTAQRFEMIVVYHYRNRAVRYSFATAEARAAYIETAKGLEHIAIAVEIEKAQGIKYPAKAHKFPLKPSKP